MVDPLGPRITGVEHKVDDIKRAVESIGNRDGNQSVTQVRFEGASQWQLTTCLLLTTISVLTAGFAMWSAMDARGEMRANNTNRERDIGELRQTDNAIRAYINTGALKPKGAK